MSLDLYRPRLNHSSHQHMTVTKPLALDAWSQALVSHPDRAFANYNCEGIQCEFRIGFQSTPAGHLATDRTLHLLYDLSLLIVGVALHCNTSCFGAPGWLLRALLGKGLCILLTNCFGELNHALWLVSYLTIHHRQSSY